jgi:GT2 family glycosyltransferase
LAQQPGLTVVTQENLGGGGGQRTGIKLAYEKGHDWYWCMDDDTIPHADALQVMEASPKFHDARTGFLSSLAYWTDGSPHVMNIQRPDSAVKWAHRVLDERSIPIVEASFVSLLLNRQTVKEVGLPIKEFFVWGDDIEYTRRITKNRVGYLILDSHVTHKTRENIGFAWDTPGRDVSLKHRYGARNQLHLMRKQATSAYMRFRITETYLRHMLVRVLRRKTPFSIFWWSLRGIWFSPKVEHVQ